MNNFISVKELSKSYTEGTSIHKVLRNVSIDLTEGEITILFGRSGSGKSTLLNLISGIDIPDSGSISIDGIEVTSLSEKARTIFRREHIGFIFQFFNLIPTLTVFENLMLPLELNGKKGKKYETFAMELLEDVGMHSRSDSYPDILSGGEQQRVAISRALVNDPMIILADEPTGNLDFENGKKVIDLLDKLVRSRNKTLLMATHSREVIGMADRILRVKDGMLIETASEEVL